MVTGADLCFYVQLLAISDCKTKAKIHFNKRQNYAKNIE